MKALRAVLRVLWPADAVADEAIAQTDRALEVGETALGQLVAAEAERDLAAGEAVRLAERLDAVRKVLKESGLDAVTAEVDLAAGVRLLLAAHRERLRLLGEANARAANAEMHERRAQARAESLEVQLKELRAAPPGVETKRWKAQAEQDRANATAAEDRLAAFEGRRTQRELSL